ncbi:MAG TPA: transaldolase [Solirubrobacterales bacterium]|nr:transaldolase [Solirubrobacterales bacterium]
MNPNEKLHEAGQSIWIDSITREMVGSGTLQGYIDEKAVTGLTSNPSIFDKAVGGSDDYDSQIRELREQGLDGEELFFQLAIADLRAAADLFAPINERTDGVDGWVSLEVSPKLAYDTDATIAQAADLHGKAERDNLFIKIPGTPEGLPAITESIANGIPVNVTLLFDHRQYAAAAHAYMEGVERRIEKGLDPAIGSVASVFISRWDVKVEGQTPEPLNDRLGILAATQCYVAYRELYETDRWQQLENAGARRQRLLFASTSTKDPKLSDTMYVSALAAPDTVNTMPEATVLAFADHGEVGELLSHDRGPVEELAAEFTEAGFDLDQIALELQQEGAQKFVDSWEDLLSQIESKCEKLGVGA